jgi:hypothetical protein
MAAATVASSLNICLHSAMPPLRNRCATTWNSTAAASVGQRQIAELVDDEQAGSGTVNSRGMRFIVPSILRERSNAAHGFIGLCLPPTDVPEIDGQSQAVRAEPVDVEQGGLA